MTNNRDMSTPVNTLTALVPDVKNLACSDRFLLRFKQSLSAKSEDCSHLSVLVQRARITAAGLHIRIIETEDFSVRKTLFVKGFWWISLEMFDTVGNSQELFMDRFESPKIMNAAFDCNKGKPLIYDLFFPKRKV